MAYNSQNDSGRYQQLLNKFYTNNTDLIDGASRAYTVTPGAGELPHYAKQLLVFVPSTTATATVVATLLNDADGTTTTFTFGPGNWHIDAFVRQVTAVTGTGVIVTAMAD